MKKRYFTKVDDSYKKRFFFFFFTSFLSFCRKKERKP